MENPENSPNLVWNTGEKRASPHRIHIAKRAGTPFRDVTYGIYPRFHTPLLRRLDFYII